MALDDFPKEAQPKLAYDKLIEYFTLHKNVCVEITILPDAYRVERGRLVDEGENEVAIPEKVLIAAYRFARQHALPTIIDPDFLPTDPSEFSQQQSSISQAITATTVMLLTNPEHVTAANFRKKVLMRAVDEQSEEDKRSSVSGDRRLLLTVVQEIQFLNSILTSPLHRQSKSPTLWHHRLWVMRTLFSPRRLPILTGEKVENHRFVQGEIRAVFRSAERHPANYYAWQYARRFLEELSKYNAIIYADLIVDTRRWCLRHPSDISGWKFLLWLLPRSESPTLVKDTIQDVAQRAVNFYLERKAVWCFLTEALGHNYVDNYFRVGILIWVERQIDLWDSDFESKEDMRKMSSWIRKYGKTMPGLDKPPDPDFVPDILEHDPKANHRCEGCED